MTDPGEFKAAYTLLGSTRSKFNNDHFPRLLQSIKKPGFGKPEIPHDLTCDLINFMRLLQNRYTRYFRRCGTVYSSYTYAYINLIVLSVWTSNSNIVIAHIQSDSRIFRGLHGRKAAIDFLKKISKISRLH